MKNLSQTGFFQQKISYICNIVYSFLIDDRVGKSMRRPEIIEAIRATLKRVAPNSQAILFGSEARGDAGPDSDVDLLILVEGDKLTLDEEETITLPLYELELKTGIVISPIVMLKKLWENRPFKTPFYVNVINEGIVL